MTPKNLNSYAKYSGLAIQMTAIIMVGVFGGIKLDEVLDTEVVFTALLSLVGVLLAIYFVVKDLIGKK